MKVTKMQNGALGALLLLMFNLFIVMMGMGLVIPILPFYVREFGATSQTLGFLVALYSIMQFFTAPFWGRFSDRNGRKKTLMIGLMGFSLAEFVYAFAGSIWMLFLSRIIAGTFGSAVMPSAMAYVGDVTDREHRASGMGYLGAAIALGTVIGPAIGGGLAEISIRLPFFIAGFSAVGACIFTFFFLKESLSESARQSLAHKKQTSFMNQVRNCYHSSVGSLMIFLLIMSFGLANFQSIFGYYAMDTLKLRPTQVGFIFLLFGIIGTVTQAFLVSRMVKRFGNARVVFFGFIVSGLGFLSLLSAKKLLLVFMAAGIFSCGNSLLRTSLNTLVSRVTKQEQGATMGLSNASQSLGNSIGPIVGGSMYRLNVYFPFIIGALVMFIMPAFVLRWKKKYVKNKELIREGLE